MYVAFDPSRKVAVVSPHGEQDISTADEFRSAVDRGCEASELVVLDFREVTFADSSVLGVIVRGAKQCKAAGSRLIIINAHGVADRAIRLTGLHVYYADPSDHPDLPALLDQT